MKTYVKFVGVCLGIGLLLLLPQKSSSQHYANLTPGDNNKTYRKVKKSIVSFGFFSPLNQHISFGYDQLIGTDLILSSQLGIIGPGVAPAMNPSKGAFLEVGTKLFFSPTWFMDGMRRMNAMQGGYFKPEIVVSGFSQRYTYNYYSNTISTNYNYTGIALMLNLGHQWIFANSFAIDMYVGIGYDVSSFDNSGTVNSPLQNNYEPSTGNYYSYISASPDFPLAFTAGVNIGVPF